MARTKGLLLQIATGDPRSISRQIVDGVRLRIATGELQPGEALPSVRGLAQQLVINPNTVAKAYAELTTEGWLEARQGLGLFVAKPRQRLSNAERKRRFDEAVQRFVSEVIPLDIDPDEEAGHALDDRLLREAALYLTERMLHRTVGASAPAPPSPALAELVRTRTRLIGPTLSEPAPRARRDAKPGPRPP